MVTVQLKFVDAGDLYLSWRWEHAPTEPRALRVPRDLVRAPLEDLSQALPSPLPGETVEQALARSLAHGALVDRSRETALAENLAKALLPYGLAMELNTFIERGIRPHLRIQPSPSTAQVPWEALRVDAGERTVHNADVSLLPPATVRNAHDRRVSPWQPSGKVVGALDPKVPGMGSVLGRSTLTSMVDQLGSRLVPQNRNVHRDELERELTDASRFVYIGHVTTADHGLDARMHLSCGAETTGRAALVGAHRPLTAADIALGHRPDSPRPWRIPNRVALIACESGGDSRFAEPTGLVTVMVRGGAEYVTSTRWTLPTDAGLTKLVPGFSPDDGSVFTDAVLAVNDAHESPDPIAALSAWQRKQADNWEATGDPRFSPVLWGAFSTTYGEEIRMR
ncbi:CHAT domain-containing protein [Allokutzneria oryzae]|uniref:CHAT domain-containing protein n=1 Tax=Allokutzneria oryzae TaxID=1378989 RepID=A0ABV6A5V2_9PSEU